MIYKNGLLQTEDEEQELNLVELFGKKDSDGNIYLSIPLGGNNINYSSIANSIFKDIKIYEDIDSKINNLNKWGKLKCNGLKCLEE